MRGAKKVNLGKKKKLSALREVRDAREAHDQNIHHGMLRGMNERSNEETSQRWKFLVGVDEAGRGPLAGPVSVGVVVVPPTFDWITIPGVKDSKKVAPAHRERIYKKARMLKRTHTIDYAVALISASTIDKIGITKAVALGIDRCFKRLALDPSVTKVKLDGLLKAPDCFSDQETIIKGDAKEKVIGLASIIAKVTRDRTMVRHARRFPQYHFDAHKGYGTELHYEAIKVHGLSALHRLSFCKNVRTVLRQMA